MIYFKRKNEHPVKTPDARLLMRDAHYQHTPAAGRSASSRNDENSVLSVQQAGIYLSKTKAGEYDKQMIALYNKLCSYFRKNYIFHKSLGIFFSPVFENKHGLGKVFLSQLGQPIDVQQN